MPLEYGFWLLLALVLAHAGAAFRHHIFQGDDPLRHMLPVPRRADPPVLRRVDQGDAPPGALKQPAARCSTRSEEHTSELQSLMRISYAVFCLQKKKLLTTIYYSTQIYSTQIITQ